TSVASDGTAFTRQIETGKQVNSTRIKPVPLRSASISRDGSTLVAPGGEMVWWDAIALKPTSNQFPLTPTTTAVALSPDGSYLVAHDPRNTILVNFDLYRVTTGWLHQSQTGQDPIAWSADARVLVETMSSGGLEIRRASTPPKQALARIPRIG